MLLGARQFFEKRGAPTPPLPYDAEVEYLESTGTQWIDTGFRRLPVSIAFDMSMTVRFTEVIGSNYVGSGFTSYNEQMFYALNSNPSTGLYMACNGRTNIANNLSSDKTAWHTCSARTVNGSVSYYFDSNLKSSFPFLGFILPCFYLFVLGTPNFSLNGLTGYQQISAARLSIDSEPVFDLIPVRFTNDLGQSEGAMYDRVSGQLFRNAGTGAFTIGPDKTSWTNPYVTDGLVAMLDGIWNAGGGEHDANAPTWEDLSGNNNDGALTSYSSVGSDSMLITGRSGVPITMPGAITDAYTIEVIARMVAWDMAPRLTAESPYPSLYFSSSNTDSFHIAFYGQGFDTALDYDVDRTQRFLFSITYDGSTIVPYVNGIQHGRLLNTNTKPSSVQTASLGNRISGGRGFNGEICAFRRYNRALTSAEIAANYAIDKARFNLP